MDAGWTSALEPEFKKPYFRQLLDQVRRERSTHTIYPPRGKVFEAFELTPFEQTKVLILGQDPYHGPGQAHGLSFSVPPGRSIPPSLRNIYRELRQDLG